MNKPEYDRKTVWEQTINYFKDNLEQESNVYRIPNSVTLNHISQLPRHYNKIVNAPIIQNDCVYVAMEYKNRGFNPIILNMASWQQAGGGVSDGCTAQEEELFRRSNYFKHLHQKYYPLKNYDTIVSNNVFFFRDGRDKGYVKMETPMIIDCVAAAAIMFPQLTRDGESFGLESDRQIMINKIRTLLYVCAKNGNDCVILSAWGCGAYGGPVKEISKMFKMVLTEFAGVFKETPFAILYNNTTINNNYDTFVREFKTY